MGVKTGVIAKDAQQTFLPLMPKALQRLLQQPDVVPIGAVSEDTAAGVALLAIDEDRHNAEISWLFVHETQRRKRIGTALMDRCLRVSRQFAVDSLTVLFPRDDATCAVEQFLTRWGMHPVPENAVTSGSFLLSGVDLSKLSADASSEHIISLKEADSTMLKRCSRSLLLSGDANVMDPELSCFYVETRRIIASLLIQESEGHPHVAWMSTGSDGTPVMLLQLIAYALKATMKRYPPETRVTYSALRDSVSRLIGRITGNEAQETEMEWFSLDGYAFRLRECREEE